jgi:hypothetical protein
MSCAEIGESLGWTLEIGWLRRLAFGVAERPQLVELDRE